MLTELAKILRPGGELADHRKRFRLFLSVIAVVLVLSIVKAAVHWLGLEFLSLNPLFTSAIAGAIFIIGFLLSSVLSDYKEAERIPAGKLRRSPAQHAGRTA